MTNNISNKESAKAVLVDIQKEMANPRIVKSAREAAPEEPGVFPISQSRWPGLGRRIRKLATHPGAS